MFPAGFDNLTDTVEFSDEEIRKVTGMAGVASRRLAGDAVCSSDLCVAAALRALDRLGWKPNSIDALILVTQTPDYFLPSTACVVHHRLGLADHCAAFDVGLGCSGYPYGMWLAAMMLQVAAYVVPSCCMGKPQPGFRTRQTGRSLCCLEMPAQLPRWRPFSQAQLSIGIMPSIQMAADTTT